MPAIFINPSYSAFSDFVETIPSVFDTEGVLLYDARNKVKMFEVREQKVVVKRYRKPLLHQRIDYTFFRQSKARRAYFYGMRLMEMAINTPTPIACVETFRCGLMSESYFVSEYCDDLDARIIREEPDGHDDLIDAVARFLVDCHEKGFIHGDTNLTNFLYHPSPSGYVISTIDINRSRFCNHPTPQQCLDSLMRLTHVRPALSRLVSRYAEIRGWNPQSSTAYVLRKLEQFEQRKQLKRVFISK